MIDKEYALKKLVTYLKYNNPYFSQQLNNVDINSADLIKKLPIMRKEYLRSNSTLITNGYTKDALVRETTNGTTDTPIEVFKSKEECVLLNLALWRMRRRIDRLATKRNATYFYNQTPQKINAQVHRDNVTMHIPMVKKSKSDFLNDLITIAKYEIQWLICSPSTAILLCELIEENSLILNVSVVELISEYLPTVYKNRIERAFNCRTVVHYSCHEVWGMAFQQDWTNELYIMEDVIIESERDFRFDRDLGNCIVTNLKLKSMPFIRYKLTDLISLTNRNQKLRTYGFRSLDSIKLSHAYIHCSFFDNIFYNMDNMSLQPLEDYQIIYGADGMRFCFIKDFDDAMIKDIVKMLKEKIYNKFNIHYNIEACRIEKFFHDKNTGKMRGILYNGNILID